MKYFIDSQSRIPLVGCIQFGIVVRGANSLVQVRPNTICNLRCSFCSVSANDNLMHPNNFEVECDYLVKWFEHISKLKGCALEANIDSVGEPMSYSKIFGLVKKLKASKSSYFVSMQTNGCFLDKTNIKRLEKNGLGRLNLSIHSFDQNKAKKLTGNSSYDLDKIKKVAREVAKTKIELFLTPVLIPSVNEEDIEKLIEFSKELGCKIGIQKYEIYKFSRKVGKVKAENYWKFYDRLKKFEKKYDTKLRYGKKDFKIHKAEQIKPTFKIGEKILVELKIPGWFKGDMIGVCKDRCVTVQNCQGKPGDKIWVKIFENKNQIYIGK